ncbi:MAG TPA: glycerol kinase [Tenacibaculum sp.]|nr:glycerol kinase [Tenacibaculum sp.]
MQKKEYIIALDQGTTSSRTAIVDKEGKIVAMSQKELTQIFPQPGWVEHDPIEILEAQIATLKEVISEQSIDVSQIVSIGITNQRETTVVWDKSTGKPIYNAIVWQDKRTVDKCNDLKKNGLAEYIKKTTGLVIDSYFSATKIHWILNNIEGAQGRAEKGELLFGTIDTWLLWNLTDGKVHATDYSNASRTMLYNIEKLQWDTQLLNELNIPENVLPEVKPSSSLFGYYSYEGAQLPISGIAGDQQAALFGQACFSKGEAKNTYGTGCFMLLNTGEDIEYSDNGLLTTIAWGIEDKVYYALEGSVFVAGSAIQWLRDGLKVIKTASDSELFANKIKGENPVYVVPAFAGLGAPYWDMNARGAVFGLTRDTGKEHLIKATLDSLAYRVKDVLSVMQKDSKTKLTSLKVDGGACVNNTLMQFQADILNVIVQRPEIIETTLMGAAYLAGIGVGIWNLEDIENNRKLSFEFSPSITEEKRLNLYKKWQKAVERTKDWID